MTASDHISLHLKNTASRASRGHPWAHLSDMDLAAVSAIEDGVAATLYTAEGVCLGSGVFDRRDACAAWRRFSWAEGQAFDSAYIAEAIEEALGRRGEEACLRLISSDADYLPGLLIEKFEDIVTITLETAVMDRHVDSIVQILTELLEPREMVFLNNVGQRASFGLESFIRTLSGRNLKGRWLEIDELFYRLDFLNSHKPRFYLDQREQHALVGSLCEGRTVLDAFSHSGAFAMQALKGGAECAVALDCSEVCVKAIGANAQRNDCFVEAIHCEAADFLRERKIGELDCIILDPPDVAAADLENLQLLHELAFACLASGGILATYFRSSRGSQDVFESMVAAAAARSGREGRVFARTGQPFDFPTLLNLPESRYLKGLILQVE